jgi:hypothetical protein
MMQKEAALRSPNAAHMPATGLTGARTRLRVDCGLKKSMASERIPADIAQCVVIALWLLRQVEASVARGAEMEKRSGVRGKYQADAFMKNRDNIQYAWRILATFRKSGAHGGIEVEAVIRELGGQPDLTPTPEAAAWLPPDIQLSMRSKGRCE